MIAARDSRTDAVVELVKGGADIDMQDKVCYPFLQLTLHMRSRFLVQVYRLIIFYYIVWKHCSHLSFKTMWE